MLRIAVQSKGRLYDETMDLLSEAGIKLTAVKRSLLVPSRNFPVELLFLRDDDIPDSVATGTADLGIVGYNEVLEKQRDVTVIKNWDSADAASLWLCQTAPATMGCSGSTAKNSHFISGHTIQVLPRQQHLGRAARNQRFG